MTCETTAIGCETQSSRSEHGQLKFRRLVRERSKQQVAKSASSAETYIAPKLEEGLRQQARPGGTIRISPCGGQLAACLRNHISLASHTLKMANASKRPRLASKGSLALQFCEVFQKVQQAFDSYPI